MDKIVVFTGSFNFSSRKAIRVLIEKYPQIRILIINQQKKKKPLAIVKNRYRSLKKNGCLVLVHRELENSSV